MKPTRARIGHRGADYRPLVEILEDRLVPGETLSLLGALGNVLAPLAELLGPSIILGNDCASCERAVIATASAPEPTTATFGLPTEQTAPVGDSEMIVWSLQDANSSDRYLPGATNSVKAEEMTEGKHRTSEQPSPFQSP